MREWLRALRRRKTETTSAPSLELETQPLETDPAGPKLVRRPAPPIDKAARHWGHLILIERIARGGFGDVYRAWDPKLDREVALKLIRPADSRLSLRNPTLALEEARLLARIRHPNVATVYGADEFDGQVGLWMEFIRGQTLATRLRDRGPFAPGDAIRIATELLGAIGALHQAGLVHGDIKPHNIILEDGGRVLLTDFGLSREIRPGPESAAIVRFGGTPPYMAPELLSGEPHSERTDLYAAGVVLYELLSGALPAPAGSFEELRRAHAERRVTSLREAKPDLPEPLCRVADRALAHDPARRFANAAEMAEALDPVLQKPKRIHRRWLAAAAVLLALAAGLGWHFQVLPWSAPAGPVSLLIADFDNQTDDNAIDLTVRELLTLALDQSRRVSVFPRARSMEALELMRQPRTARIGPSIARQICRREGLGAYLFGGIAPAGNGYQITVRLADAGDSIQSVSTEFLAGKRDLPAGIDRIAREVRGRLGENRMSMAFRSQPLERVTTASIDALERYTRAVESHSQGRMEDSLNWLQSALERDAEFAMACRLLSVVYSSLGRYDDSLETATRAFRLRERASERERHLIEGVYHLRRCNYVEAAEAYRTVSALYPRDETAPYQLAQIYSLWGDFPESLRFMRRALEIHPLSLAFHGIHVRLLTLAEQNDEALEQVRLAREKSLDGPVLTYSEAWAWLCKGDHARAKERLRSLFDTGAAFESSAHLAMAQILTMEGKLQEAQSHLETSAFSHLKHQHPENEARARSWLARLDLLRGDRGHALSRVGPIAVDRATPARLKQLRNLALIYTDLAAFSLAEPIVRQIEAIAAEYPNVYSRGLAAQVRGELRRAAGDGLAARAFLERASSQWRDVATLWSMAQWHYAQRDYAAAFDAYREVISRKGWALDQEFAGTWVLAHLQAARCQRRLADYRKAADYYDRFLRFWGNENLGLPLVQEARQERLSLASLQF